MSTLSPPIPRDPVSGVPLVDLHAHLQGQVTVARAVEIGHARGVRLGIVEHGGYGWQLEDDAALFHYLDSLAGYPVWRGMQAEGLDWPGCFSAEGIASLDYILGDALSFPERDGRKVRLWQSGVQIEDVEDFMDRYVDWNVQIMCGTLLDILANATFLPACIADRYDTLWTLPRIDAILEAVFTYCVAIEINDRYQIPSLAFIQRARHFRTRRFRVRFSFGSNQHGTRVAGVDYCVYAARACGLGPEDIFLPGQEEDG